jgi:hypothetical protein
MSRPRSQRELGRRALARASAAIKAARAAGKVIRERTIIKRKPPETKR